MAIVLLGPLTALPVGLGIAALRSSRVRWRVAAALASALPALFILRTGLTAVGEPAGVGILVVSSVAVAAWSAAGRWPPLRPLALGLTALGAAVLLVSVGAAFFGGPTCEERMLPPTPS